MSSEGKGGAGEDGGGEEKVKVQETTFSPHTRTYTPLTTPQISRFRPSASALSSGEGISLMHLIYSDSCYLGMPPYCVEHRSSANNVVFSWHTLYDLFLNMLKCWSVIISSNDISPLHEKEFLALGNWDGWMRDGGQIFAIACQLLTALVTCAAWIPSSCSFSSLPSLPPNDLAT